MPKAKPKSHAVNFKFPQELITQIDHVRSVEGVTRSEAIRRAVQAYCKTKKYKVPESHPVLIGRPPMIGRD